MLIYGILKYIIIIFRSNFLPFSIMILCLSQALALQIKKISLVIKSFPLVNFLLTISSIPILFNFICFFGFICDSKLTFVRLILKRIQKITLYQMESLTHSDSRASPSVFTKGMTLSDYMAGLSLEEGLPGEDPSDEKQQNLYEQLEQHPKKGLGFGRERFSIRQVDEQSAEESAEGGQDQFSKQYGQQQMTKQTFRQSNFFMEHPPSRVQHPMNATAYFNHSNEKHTFRVKHLSNSPFKKKTESPVQGVPMTLYGRKFAQSIGKDTRVPQLATFYGRMKQRTQKTQERIPQREKAAKQKGNFKKKGQLQLQELIKFEQKIKNNYSQKIYFQDIRIDGIRDKICERKNKLY